MLSNIECRYQITSNEYADFMADNTGNDIDIINYFKSSCFQIINERNAVVYLPLSEVSGETLIKFGAPAYPKVYGLMDTSSLEASSISRMRTLPSMNLRGAGVLFGILDTGIDYTNPVFRKADGTSRISAIWDQTIESENYPTDMYYGTEYSKEEVDAALMSEDPYQIVPSRDENGHGTFISGIGAGNIDESNDFSGVAPDSELVVVKLKEAKPYLKEFYMISPEISCYQENDIMRAVMYLVRYARSEKKPIVICIGVGTSQGAHDERGALSAFLSEMADMRGVVIVSAAGNEGSYGHHYSGTINQSGNSDLVEVNVAENEYGFTMELWGASPNTYSIDILSPAGEFIPRIPARRKENRVIRFLMEETVIYINYVLIEHKTGDELILLRFLRPTPGVWKFHVFGKVDIPLTYHIWLPLQGFLMGNTYFLNSDPNTTITSPANSDIPITVTAYDHRDQSLYQAAGRGYTRSNLVKPDIAAPGVNILGPCLDKTFAVRSGTSIAAAHTAGVAALLLEWGIVRGNYYVMDTTEAKKFMIRGARRNASVVYPNREWGYGILDIYNIFVSLREDYEA